MRSRNVSGSACKSRLTGQASSIWLKHGASHLLSQPPGKPICVFPQRTRVGVLVTRYGLHCLHLFWRRNRKSIMADSRAYVGLDAMLKSFPGAPGLSDRMFYGSGNGEGWNSH
jgi:hypothetical protein